MESVEEEKQLNVTQFSATIVNSLVGCAFGVPTSMLPHSLVSIGL